MPNDAAKDEVRLVRGLNLLDATTIVVGSMIGSGIFIVSAESARLLGAPGWLLLAWLLAGIMTITGALCFGELAAMMPKAGGPYVFMTEAYGRPVGFLYGWSQFFIVQSGTIAAVAVAFANFTGILVPQFSGTNYVIQPVVFGSYAVSLSTQQLLAIVSIALLTFINTRGLRLGKAIQNSFTFTKTAALLGLVVVGIFFGWNSGGALLSSAWWNSLANGWNLHAVQPAAETFGPLAFLFVFGKAMAGPLFSQSAWDNVTFTGAEVENPGRNLPRALIIGCLIVVSLYMLANVAYAVTLSLPDLQNAPNGRVATAVMQQILGTPGVIIIALALMISTFGCNNGLDPFRLAGFVRNGKRRLSFCFSCQNEQAKRARNRRFSHSSSGRRCSFCRGPLPITPTRRRFSATFTRSFSNTSSRSTLYRTPFRSLPSWFCGESRPNESAITARGDIRSHRYCFSFSRRSSS